MKSLKRAMLKLIRITTFLVVVEALLLARSLHFEDLLYLIQVAFGNGPCYLP